MKREIKLGNKLVNDQSPCFVIAEIGNNHQGDISLCKKLFEQAAKCGADAVKLQKRNISELFTRDFYNSPYQSQNSFGNTYGSHREYLELSEEEFTELKEYADKIGLVFCSTAFDFSSADFLEKLNTDFIKIASADITNIPLIKHIASKSKPFLMSTGASEINDVNRAYNESIKITENFAILQCTSSYPARTEELDLKVISKYRELYPKTVIGFSAHDNSYISSLGAFAMGAGIIEKHFTLDKSMKGTDHAFSLNPAEMKMMINSLKELYQAMGDGEKKIYESEKASLFKMSKKIVASRNLKAGKILESADFALKSPGDGLEAYYLDYLTGKVLKYDLQADEAFKKESVEEK